MQVMVKPKTATAVVETNGSPVVLDSSDSNGPGEECSIMPKVVVLVRAAGHMEVRSCAAIYADVALALWYMPRCVFERK